MPYYDRQGRQISRQVLIDALNRLGDKLRARKTKIDLVCCGGVVSVLHHKARNMTHDVDAIFPEDSTKAWVLRELIDQVGMELGLETGNGPEDLSGRRWFNDSVNLIGLFTTSDTIVFKHPYLILRAAGWEEMLSHKLSAFRGEHDIVDAIEFLKNIDGDDPGQVFEQVQQYKPFRPEVDDKLRYKRFMQIWQRVNG